MKRTGKTLSKRRECESGLSEVELLQDLILLLQAAEERLERLAVDMSSPLITISAETAGLARSMTLLSDAMVEIATATATGLALKNLLAKESTNILLH